MNLLDGWTGRFLLLYIGWPLIVMLSFVFWHSLRGRSLSGLAKGVFAAIAFTALVTLFWGVASIVALALVTFLLDGSDVDADTTRVVLVGLMVVAMVVGAIRGWRWLANDQGTDPHSWQL